MDSIGTYKAVFESSPDGIVITDQLGKILIINKQLENLFGYKEEELIGQNIELLIPLRYHNIHAEKHKEFVSNLSAREINDKKDLFANKKNGNEFAAEISLNPIHLEDRSLFSAIIRDVTEKKITEKKIFESNPQFYNTLENLLEGIQIISFDFRYLYVNDALVKQSGYTRAELLGNTMMEKYPGIENSKMFELLKKCMIERKGQLLENEFTFPDETKGYFELSIQPSPEGAFILSQDITTRKLNEQEILSKNKKLEFQNKELEQFTYVTSHDLQEPLRSLISFTDLLQKEYSEKLEGNGNVYVDFISKSAVRMRDLVKGLLDYTRIGLEKELSHVDCNQILNEVLADMSIAIKESHAIITVNDLPTLNCYAIEIRQVFQNLIDNALKFRKKISHLKLKFQEKNKIRIGIFL